MADRACPASLSDVKDEVEVSTSPPVSEFVSDAFDSCKINEDDLRKEMQQLVLDKNKHPNTQQGESFGFTGLIVFAAFSQRIDIEFFPRGDCRLGERAAGGASAVRRL